MASKSRRKQMKIKAINIPGIIKSECVCWRRFINVEDELIGISFGNIGSCGGGIRR
jgi:hypothetical protein